MRICLRCKKVGAGVDRCTLDRKKCLIRDRGTIIVPVTDVLYQHGNEGAFTEMHNTPHTGGRLPGDAAPRPALLHSGGLAPPNPYPQPPAELVDLAAGATPGGMAGEPIIPKRAAEVASGTVAGSILTEAAGIVEGVRNAQHGHKERSFAAIARMWTAYLRSRQGAFADIRPEDVAQMMVLMKQMRAEWGTPMRDHFVDAAGYSGIAGELALRPSEEPEDDF